MTKDEALRLALEALENITSVSICEATHHAKKDRHLLCEDCPNEVRHLKAITAIKAALEAKDEPIKLRRGDILRCIETDELCTVWATSTSGKTLVKWKANDFCNYTAEQIGELFWLEPKSSEIETQQTPVAWMTFNDLGEEDDIHYENPEAHLLEGWTYKPLYTTPPQRLLLADEPIENAIHAWFKPNSDGNYGTWQERMRAAIKAAIKEEKNE